MKTKKISEILILTGVLLYPFQNLTLPVYGSTFDFTVFLFLMAAIFVTFRGFLISKNALSWYLFFAAIQIIIFIIINAAPFHRLISGLIWFGGLVLIFLSRNLFSYKSAFVYKLIIVLLLISALFCFYTASHEGLFSRPQAWFSEPSFAGLSFYSASAGLFGGLMLLKMNYRTALVTALFASIFLLAGLLTLSMHVVPFVFVILLILTLQLSFKQLPIIVLAVSALFFLLMSLSEINHFASRINITENITNASLLAWLYGFDQMLSAFALSPLFGMGLGSTGYFAFESDYAEMSSKSEMGITNLTDAYSALFRIGIELGLPFLSLLVFYLYARFSTFKQYVNSFKKYNSEGTLPIVFLFIFSFTMTLGILLKEPTYSRSFVYISWFFLVTCLPSQPQQPCNK